LKLLTEISSLNPVNRDLQFKPFNPQAADSLQGLALRKNELLRVDSLSDNPLDLSSNLVASFNSGTWYHDRHTGNWNRLTTSRANALARADLTADGFDEEVYSFTSGVFYLERVSDQDKAWKNITSSQATALVGGGPYLYVSLPSGTYEYDSGHWYKLADSAAYAMTFANIVDDGSWNLVASFASGTWFTEWIDEETWKWVRLSSTPAIALAGYPYDNDLIASFPSGTWRYFVESENWFRFSSSAANNLTYSHITDIDGPNLVASYDSGTFFIDWRQVGGQWEWFWDRLSLAGASSMQGLNWYYPISFVASFTGVIEEIAESGLYSAILAESDINRWLEQGRKGWRVRLLPDDDLESVEVAQQLLEIRSKQGVKFFVGPMYSFIVEGCLDVANTKELLLVSPWATRPGINTADDWLYRFNYDDNYFDDNDELIPQPILGDYSNRDHVRNFIVHYLGREPTHYDYNTYDVVWSLALSILEVGYDAKAVKDVLPGITEEWSEIYGASGLILLNEDGDRVPPY